MEKGVSTVEIVSNGINKRNFIIKLSWLMSGGMFVDGFVLGYIGMVMPAMSAELGLSLYWQGLIGAAALFGTLIGAPIGGWLSNRIGRRPMFTFDLFLFVFCSVAQFFVSDPITLFIVRVLMGAAIGIEYAVGWPFLAEFSPAKIRGKLLCLTEIAWYTGFLASYFVGYVLTVIYPTHWNIILGLSTIPSVIVLILRWGTPESPHWLMSKGRKEEAMAIAEKYMDEEQQEDVLNYKHGDTTKNAGFFDLFKLKHRKSTIFFVTMFIGSSAPYYAMVFFIPHVLEKLGLEDGFTGGLFLNVLAVVGTVLCTIFAERVSRRKMITLPFLISTIALVVIAIFGQLSANVMLICFLTYALFNAWTGAILAVFPSEIFTSDISSLGTGFATCIARVVACVGTFLLPSVIENYGATIIIWVAAFISLISTVIAQLYCPNTKGKKISEIFH